MAGLICISCGVGAREWLGSIGNGDPAEIHKIVQWYSQDGGPQ